MAGDPDPGPGARPRLRRLAVQAGYAARSPGRGPSLLGSLRAAVYLILAGIFLLPAMQTWERSEKRSRVLVLLDTSPSVANTSDDLPEDGTQPAQAGDAARQGRRFPDRQADELPRPTDRTEPGSRLPLRGPPGRRGGRIRQGPAGLGRGPLAILAAARLQVVGAARPERRRQGRGPPTCRSSTPTSPAPPNGRSAGSRSRPPTRCRPACPRPTRRNSPTTGPSSTSGSRPSAN